MNDSIIKLTEDNFDTEVAQSTMPVLVDFWAEWCGPCRMISPIIEEIAASPNYQGKLKVGKLNVDESPAIAAKYSVRGIPTLMIFKNGQVEETQVGAVSKPQLTAFVDKHV